MLEAGIGNVVINHMDYRTYDGKMIVGTHGNGVYSTNLGVLPAFASNAESNVAHSVLVYPTITTEILNVSAEKSERVEIYNLQGKLVLSSVTTSDFTTLNVSALNSGTYVIVVYYDQTRAVKKFVRG